MMLDKAWRLSYDSSVVGIRIKKDNTLYDIDIEPFRGKPLDIDILPSLVMREYGDLIMTEEEFQSKQTIAELPFSENLVGELKAYIKQYRLNDRYLRAAYFNRIKKLRQEYYTYLPDAWLKDFAEYHEDNFGGNRNIYTVFNDVQRNLIVDYFRWRSKVLFDEAKQNRVLRKSMKKAHLLADIMGDAEDWYYDGSVDTGYMGGGHCTLGHALRYKHFAVSRSTNVEVVFGATCMSDFFDLDKTLLDNISKAQDKMIKEIKVISYLMDSDRFGTYKEEYSELWDIMKHFKGRFKEKVPNGNGWASFMGNFDAKGLPLTRPMVEVYFKLRSLYGRETNTPVESKNSESVVPYSYEYYKLKLDNYALNYDIKVLKELFKGRKSSSLATVLLGCTPKSEKDFTFIAKGLKLVERAEKVASYLNSKEGGSITLGYSIILKVLVNTEYPIYDDFKERRLATYQEEMSGNPNIVKEYFFTERRKRAVNYLFKYTLEKAPLIRSTEYVEYVSEFMDNYTIIEDLINVQYENWIRDSLDKLTYSYMVRQKSKKEFEKKNPDRGNKPAVWGETSPRGSNSVPSSSSSGEVKRQTVGGKTRITPYQTEGKFGNGMLVAEMYDYLKTNSNLMTPNEAKRFDRIPNHDLENHREGLFIFNVYERALKRAKDKELENIEPRLTNVSIYNSYVENLFELIENSSLDRKDIVFSIIDTVRTSKNLSDKQKKVIRSALARVM